MLVHETENAVILYTHRSTYVATCWYLHMISHVTRVA